MFFNLGAHPPGGGSLSPGGTWRHPGHPLLPPGPYTFQSWEQPCPTTSMLPPGRASLPPGEKFDPPGERSDSAFSTRSWGLYEFSPKTHPGEVSYHPGDALACPGSLRSHPGREIFILKKTMSGHIDAPTRGSKRSAGEGH